MAEDLIRPLAGRNGVAPIAPNWFSSSIASPHETVDVVVDGVRIDARVWGPRGAPGIVLLHGNAAHLGWWSFLAPMLAEGYRVTAFSLSGMGRSGWRDRYSIDGFVDEMWAVADASGAIDAGPPILIGHSMGGAPVLRAAATGDRPVRAAVVVDTALPGPELVIRGEHAVGTRRYPGLVAALDRFRLSPGQPCENAYIADYLARMSVRALSDGEYGWRFDPKLWSDTEFGDGWASLAAVRVPLAVVRGGLSELSGGAMLQRMRAVAPVGTPFIDIPEAYHHVMVDQPLALVAALRTLLAAWA